MEPSKEVPAATQPVVNRAPRIMPVEKPALALQMDSAIPKISGEPGTTCICTCPRYLSFSERGANQPMGQYNHQPCNPGANGAKNYHSPSLQSHTMYLWNQPITQVKSILQNLTPTLPAREHQLPHNQRINVAPT